MEQLLRKLLTKLNEINRQYPEVTDTAVAEKLTDAIYQGFLKPV